MNEWGWSVAGGGGGPSNAVHQQKTLAPGVIVQHCRKGIEWAILTLQYIHSCSIRVTPPCSSSTSWRNSSMWITFWYEPLQPFNFTVVHKLGAQMVVIDFLSLQGRVDHSPHCSPAHVGWWGYCGRWGYGLVNVCSRSRQSKQVNVGHLFLSCEWLLSWRVCVTWIEQGRDPEKLPSLHFLVLLCSWVESTVRSSLSLFQALCCLWWQFQLQWKN